MQMQKARATRSMKAYPLIIYKVRYFRDEDDKPEKNK